MKQLAKDYAPRLAAGRWFGALPAELQTALLDAALVRSLAAGAIVFQRGDRFDGLHAVASGAVRLAGNLADGRQAVVAIMGPPMWFGEIALFDDLPRTHDAVCDEETLLLTVPHARLLDHLSHEPGHWRHIALLMASQLRLLFVALEEMSFLPTPLRVARRLALIAAGYGESDKRFVVDLKQEDLAAMLGLSRQTTNQALRTLEAQGLIRVTYGQIEICDFAGLEAAAR